jgi:hypothetical protein
MAETPPPVAIAAIVSDKKAPPYEMELAPLIALIERND